MAKGKSTSPKRVKGPKSEWMDISIPLRNAMVHWPTDDSPRIHLTQDAKKGDEVTLTEMTILSHTGTHIDAPRHFIVDGTTIDEMPLDAIIGPARVIEIKDTESIKPEELAAYDIQPGERILFKTVNSSKCYKSNEFIEDFVHISNEAAQFLKDKKVSVVGVDYIAIGSYKDRSNLVEVHNTLVGNGIWAIEGLNLSAVKAGRYELICLPLRLEKGDAGPARAIVRPI